MHRCICCVFVCINVVLFLFLQEFLLGDCTKAQTKLGWKHKYDFDVSIMFEYSLKLLQASLLVLIETITSITFSTD